MSIITNSDRPSAPEAAKPAADDPFGTSLISRLANEIYSEFRAHVPASGPRNSESSRLGAELPPVHPAQETPVGQTSQPSAVPSGGAEENSYAFGEPRGKSDPGHPTRVVE